MLTYEEFKAQYFVRVTDTCVNDLERLHNIDVNVEIESVYRQEYDQYVERYSL